MSNINLMIHITVCNTITRDMFLHRVFLLFRFIILSEVTTRTGVHAFMLKKHTNVLILPSAAATYSPSV